jgi:hypothetical protein
MCKRHWFSLPKQFRDRIWATYRPGQEDDKQPSSEYCDAAIACVRFIAVREGREPDTRLYERFRPEAT